MVIGATADLHGYLPPIPEGLDVLLIAGDIGAYQGENLESFKGFSSTLDDFAEWMVQAECPVIGVAGNHDFTFERDPQIPLDLPWHYLLDSSVEIGGLLFHGSPWVPNLPQWAFHAESEDALAEKFALIPTNTSVLLTHGPPFGIGDQVRSGERVGSEALNRRLFEHHADSLKLHVFGHIHEGGGVRTGPCANVSYVGRDYTPNLEIQVFEIDP
jgi:Icc-related predicted phosphoesterase